MKIDWNKTMALLKRADFSEKEIERFKKDPVETTARLLDEGKRVPLSLHRQFLAIISLKGEAALRTMKKKEWKERERKREEKEKASAPKRAADLKKARDYEKEGKINSALCIYTSLLEDHSRSKETAQAREALLRIGKRFEKDEMISSALAIYKRLL
ncbi:hypothetical protein L6386_00975 [bacterium]|nr:hypothetical protein [bacterium]